MFGLGRPRPIDEHEAEGEIERVYHEIRQTLRVTGVNLVFRAWAAHKDFLPAVWDAVRPNVETRAFEDAADRIRADAVWAAAGLGRLDALSHVRLGESQRYQAQAALDLYHYVNPKLLVLTCAIALALRGDPVGGTAAAGAQVERILPGAPPRMYPMEMVHEVPDDARLRVLFDDIKRTLGLRAVNSDYRTLALWPSYLEVAWRALRPVAMRPEHAAAAEALRQTARDLARQLPHPLPLSPAGLRHAVGDFDAVVELTDSFERLLPGLILNVALCALDFRPPEPLARSPFPAPSARAPGGAR